MGWHYVLVRGDSDATGSAATQHGWHTSGAAGTPVGSWDRLTVSSSSDLQRTLLNSPDTVTHFLETLTGDRLVADVVRQYPVTAGTDNELGVGAGHAVTQRMTVLKGRATSLPYVYAESMFVPERVPEPVRAQLERTRDPIGRVLVAHGVRLGREPLPQPEPVGAHAPNTVAERSSEIVWSRAYRLTIDGVPAFAIREWFLRSVLDALDRRAGG